MRRSVMPLHAPLSSRRHSSSARGSVTSTEFVLELETPWEAEAWAEAISESREALVRACDSGRWESVPRLLDAGRAANVRESNGRSALHYACGHGERAAVRALLDAGASTSLADHAGVYPISFAALHSSASLTNIRPACQTEANKGGREAKGRAECGCGAAWRLRLHDTYRM